MPACLWVEHVCLHARAAACKSGSACVSVLNAAYDCMTGCVYKREHVCLPYWLHMHATTYISPEHDVQIAIVLCMAAGPMCTSARESVHGCMRA